MKKAWRLRIITLIAFFLLTPYPATKAKLPQTPANDELRPDLKDWHPDYETLCWELIRECGFQADCNDLLLRLARCHEDPDAHRLPVVSYVHRDPFKLERVTHEIVDPMAQRPSLGVADCVFFVDHMAAVLTAFGKPQRTGHPARPATPPLPTGDLNSHLDYIKETLNEAAELNKNAFDALTDEDVRHILKHRKDTLDWYIDARLGFPRTTPKLLDLAAKVNLKALFDQARVAAHLVSPQFTTSLLNAAEKSGKDLNASTIAQCNTPHGKVLIAGLGRTRYDQADYAAIYDLGGDDVYANNIATSIRGSIPTAIIVDYAGDDAYETYRPFSQGCGDFGVGMLVDLSGSDNYIGTRFSQGTGFCGVGMLFDEAGDDVYRGLEFHQGLGHWGAGALVDRAGNDRYESHNTSQAVGMAGGFGLLCDGGNGRDSYYCKGRDPGAYGDPGVFEGSGQGMGVGYRRYASGGIGVLYDHGGQDRFEAGNFSQGGGYYYGFGILYNDGSDRDNYIGSRYAQGFGCHQAAGAFIEAGGDDLYQTRHKVAQGLSWDQAVALFVDEQGDDRYEEGGFSHCASAMNGWTIFLERGGKDTYFDTTPAIGHWASNTYHGGTSLSFFVDLGGQEDAYPTAENNTIMPGGEWALFLDLPSSIADAMADNAWRKMLERPKNGRKALYLALLAGDKDTAQSLIEQGTDINSKDENGQTLLLFACSRGHRNATEFLIANGADVNAKDKNRQTTLHSAAKEGYEDVVELLIANNADVNAKNKYGRTPLHSATWRGRMDVTELLLANGANVNAKDKNGKTPLHFVAERGYEDLAGLLIANGADVTVKNKEGRTPLGLAKDKGHKEVVELLRKHGAKE